MIINSLKFLTLQNICSNLDFNFLLCKKNGYRISSFLSDLILDHLCCSIHTFNEDNLHIFNKDITSLTKFSLTYEICKYPNFLLKIDKNYLNKISCYPFYHHSRKNAKISIKNLIKDCHFLKIIKISSDYKLSWILDDLIILSKSLEEISLDLTEFNTKEWETLEILFKNCTNLKIVHVNCGITTNCCKLFNTSQKLLKSKETLVELKISNLNSIFSLKTFLNIFKSVKNFQILYFLNCKFSYNRVENMFLEEKNHSNEEDESNDYSYLINIRKFKLYQCKFHISEFKSIENMLKNMEKLEIVDLSYNKFMILNFSNLFNCLIYSTKNLKQVILTDCDLKFENCEYLGKLLHECWNIEKLLLDQNQNMADGLIYVCQGLINSSKTLKRISFENCNLSVEHCKFIGKFITDCSNIEYIQLSENEKIRDGFKYILNGLINCFTTLKRVELSFCYLSEKSIKSLRDATRSNTLKVCHEINYLNVVVLNDMNFFPED